MESIPTESLAKSARPNPSRRVGFSDTGFLVFHLKHHIDEDEMIALNEIANNSETTPIFNQEIQRVGIDAKNDRKRQSSISIHDSNVPVIKEMIRVINDHAQVINPEYSVQKSVVLRSEDGCEKQAEHTDGTDTKLDFCSCLFAIQEGTKIDMNGRTIHLDIGDAIFFHSDVLHNGCCYSNKNNRYFFYIAKEKDDYPSNEVGDVIPRYCQHCNEVIYYENAYNLSDEIHLEKMRRMVSNHYQRICLVKNSKQKLVQRKEQAKVSTKESRKKRKEKKPLVAVDDDDD
jgi:hypothetical protein